MTPSPRFFNAYAQGFLRAAVAAPSVRPADPVANIVAIAAAARRAHDAGAAVTLTPELGITGYAIDDLLHQTALLDAAEAAIGRLAAETAALRPLLIVGAPLRLEGRLHNCGVVLHRGRILGVVPKTYLPNYREFYEARHFAPATAAGAGATTIRVAGQTAPFGVDVLFVAEDLPGFTLALEICEDLWTPIPPSARATLAGATLVANLSASNATIGKSDYRHALCRVTSARQICGYLYSAAGRGESTTDLAWDGHAMIYDNGDLLAESARFSDEDSLIVADVDLERLTAERLRTTSFAECCRIEGRSFRRVGFRVEPDLDADLGLMRTVARFPFVPDDPARLDALCDEAYAIQIDGLRQRLAATGVGKIVIGVSGGLDSTQALLVAARAMDRLERPRTDILAYTLPAFATSDATRSTAWALMRALGVTAAEVDMTPACRQMLRDIGHPAADGARQYDIAFENVQAGARTSFLFRAANHHGGLVLGTGDLSEAALGWSTYGVGDQMSHYNVNASAPKTLIQHLIRRVAARAVFGSDVSEVLQRVLETEISPELVPGDGDRPAQRTEDFVGPYALQDFTLYHLTRHGLRPSRIAWMQWLAWRDAATGRWPEGIGPDARVAHDLPEILRWMRVFLNRFFATSQFKRSAQPNGPKISSGGSLSPRGDWRAPSDGSATVWLAELDAALEVGPVAELRSEQAFSRD
jgi:NAD+ synthase (glutamine-hydrolysing)